MSLQDILSPPIEPWSNLYVNSINSNSQNISGPLVVSSATSPIISAVTLNSTAGNANTGFQTYNFDHSSGIRITTVNQPTPQTSLNVDGNLNITTLENTATISFFPNVTPALQFSFISSNNTLANFQNSQVSIPKQQYVEYDLLTQVLITNGVTTPVIFDTLIRNVGDIVYNNTNGIFTINTTGTYLIAYNLNYVGASDSTLRSSQIFVVGSSTRYAALSLPAVNSGAFTSLSSSCPIYFTAGQTVYIQTTQNSSAPLYLFSGACNITRLS
jgi:C1q domain